MTLVSPGQTSSGSVWCLSSHPPPGACLPLGPPLGLTLQKHSPTAPQNTPSFLLPLLIHSASSTPGQPSWPHQLLLLFQDSAELGSAYLRFPPYLSTSTRTHGSVSSACLPPCLLPSQAAPACLTHCQGPGITSPGPRGCLLKQEQGQRCLPPVSSCPVLGDDSDGSRGMC